MTKRLFFLFLFTGCCISAKANFDFNSNCLKAYSELINLRLANARMLIDAEKKKNPGNAIPVLLDNYLDYFTVTTSESKADFDRLKNNKSARLNRLEKEDKNSPWYLYSQAEINLQWALMHGLFQEYVASSFEINKAFRLLQDNAKKYPAFLPNQKGLGLVNAVLGSIPEGLKKALSIFGIRGNTRNGVKMLESLVNALPKSAYASYYDESVFILAYVQTDIVADNSAYPQIMANARQIDSSSLLRTYISTYSAIRMGHNEDALAVIATRPTGKEYPYFPKMDYLTGMAHMHKLDQGAARYLLDFIQNYKGINGIKDAYLNLAWLALLRGNAVNYRENIDLVKSKGYTYNDKDNQALTEANDPAPDTDLLRARLLFDGGYYDKALAAIIDRKAESFKIPRDKVEFCYRLGRIYDETAKDDTAIKFYQLAITVGRKERYYFASNAALRIANIYEKRQDKTQAIAFYNQVLGMNDHDYQKSIDNKAKEGLKRLQD